MISKTFPITETIRHRRTVKPAMMDPDLEVPNELIDELLESRQTPNGK